MPIVELCPKARLSSALLSVIALGATAFITPSRVMAAAIVSDDFSSFGTAPYTIVGNAPSIVDLPGSTYTTNGGGNTAALIGTDSTSGVGNPQPAVTSGGTTGYQGDLALSLASSGTYVKPTVFTVSADLRPGTIVGSSAGERGIGIGFYSSVTGTQFTNNHYSGFAIDTAGELSLLNDTTTTGFSTPAVASVAFGGTFDPNAFYKLTYTIDTATGAVSNVSLGGSTADYSSLDNSVGAIFTSAQTSYLALYASSASGNAGQYTGYIDNVLVATPEPSTLGLAGISAIGLLSRRRHRI